MSAFGWEFPHPSRRMPVLADNVVATSQPLAAQAGLALLAAGGNAVDAALAAAIALTVVEPTSNGIGGDAFALVWDGERLHGLNASGRAPLGLPAERLQSLPQMPARGWDTVTVPGAVSAWAALAQRFATRPLLDLAAPAIRYARDGFLVSPITALAWQRAEQVFAGFDNFAATFLPRGRAPRPGERIAFPDHARTLEDIAATDGESFYRGRLAEAIAAHAAAEGAALSAEDLDAHEPEWVDALSQEHRGWELYELPPNGQGIAALIALGLLADLPDDVDPGAAEAVHWQAEALKLALADVHRHVADPEAMRVTPAALLDGARLRELARTIDPGRAHDRGRLHATGGTVYVAAADAHGMAVSFIQSNYAGFGSGVVVPGTGIALQNRGAGFSTQPGHPNVVAPRKRPFHTIIPAFARSPASAGPDVAFGVMGGPMQAQGHVQVLLRMVAGENPQAALDAPRWRVDGGLRLSVEHGFRADTLDALRARGHELHMPGAGLSAAVFGFGGAQLVARLPGGWLGASDPRKDGHAVGW